MLEYILKNESVLRIWGLCLYNQINATKSCLKELESDSAWKASIPPYIFMQFVLQRVAQIG
jgi:hypothetical protein